MGLGRGGHPYGQIFMRGGYSTGVSRPGILDTGCHVADRAQAERERGRAERCSCLDGCVLRDTTQQHNTHIIDAREICYSWHPWHGRAVRVQASRVKRGQAVACCSLEDVPACRVLEVPLWMLDVATCCKTRASKLGFASAQSLRDLKEVLPAARPPVPAPIASKAQPRYLLQAGGADGSIDGPAEFEPTPIVGSSAMQPALDESVVRCSTKTRAIAGAVTEATSSNAGRGGNRRGGAQ
jgi:hypothetical protein